MTTGSEERERTEINNGIQDLLGAGCGEVLTAEILYLEDSVGSSREHNLGIAKQLMTVEQILATIEALYFARN